MLDQVSVLVVEDNVSDQQMIKEMLKSEPTTNFEISTAINLYQAIEALENMAYDIVILDLILPDSQGFVTCMTLLDRFPGTLIIVLTGADEDNLGPWCSRLGAEDFLRKQDLSGEILSKTIIHAIERHGLKNRLRSVNNNLRRTQERLEWSLELAGVGTWEIVEGTNDMYWSPSVYDIFGLPGSATPPSLEMFLQQFSADGRNNLRNGIFDTLSSGIELSGLFPIPVAEKQAFLRARRLERTATHPATCFGTIQDMSLIQPFIST